MANRLINSKSPYLREAAHQPVDWYEWSDEAFEKARQEDKPILLSIGGAWCHWCHVMARECFENLEIAQIINEHFIPIKVDRDERPDVDRRYQEFVVALTGNGGWPLTVFLTPEGKPFFGGTYFPPEDRWGKPGFKNLLQRIIYLWREQREAISAYAEDIFRSLLHLSRQALTGAVDWTLLERGISSLLSNIDLQYGGLGSAPKFHHAKAFELLLYHHFFEPRETLLKAILVSLDAMAKGGVYDHLLGGFFRYSTDNYWHIPHFEKMLYDNAELLSLYSIAYQVFGKNLYKEIAEGIVEYYKKFGSEREGGFYASQDADIGLLEEGGYYTFTRKEIEGLLSTEELRIADLYFGFKPLPHEKERLVLYLQRDEEEISKITSLETSQIRNILRSIKKKLLHYRENNREMPFIDRTIYTNWNALMIMALCDFYKVFSAPWAKEQAEKTATRLLKEHYKEGELFHTEGVKGFAEDYLFLSQALLSLFEITQESPYLTFAIELTRKAIDLFWDSETWGFFDSKEEGPGLLKVRLKNIQDTPTQAVNGAAPYILLLLGTLTGDSTFISYAEKTLQAFSGIIKEMPIISPSYLISLYAYIKGIFKVETKSYFEEALKSFRPFKFVLKRDVEGLVMCEGQSCKRLDSWESWQNI